MAEVLQDIDRALDLHGNIFASAFLQDADALREPTANLVAVLRRIKERFPSVQEVTTYGRASSLYTKSLDELEELRDAGLSRIHRGLETGYDALLRYMSKGATAKLHIASGQRVKQSKIRLSDYVMPGLGGNLQLEGELTWKRHVEETAYVLHEVNPDCIRLRTLTVAPRSPLAAKVAAGEFERLSDQEIMREIRFFIECLTVTSRVESDHVLNVLMELQGTMPEDKGRMLGTIDAYLGMSVEEQLGFRLGVLSGICPRVSPEAGRFHTLEAYERSGAKEKLSQAVSERGIEKTRMRIQELLQMCI